MVLKEHRQPAGAAYLRLAVGRAVLRRRAGGGHRRYLGARSGRRLGQHRSPGSGAAVRGAGRRRRHPVDAGAGLHAAEPRGTRALRPAAAAAYLAARGRRPAPPDAQWELARLYEKGTDRHRARSGARRWNSTRSRPTQDYAKALNDMGYFYYQGDMGLPQDVGMALDYFERAAEPAPPRGAVQLCRADRRRPCRGQGPGGRRQIPLRGAALGQQGRAEPAQRPGRTMFTLASPQGAADRN